MVLPLASIEHCATIAGLRPHEMLLGASLDDKHEELLLSYGRGRSPSEARRRIVADIRAAVRSAAADRAADLLIVLRLLIAFAAKRNPCLASAGARRSSADARARFERRTPFSLRPAAGEAARILAFRRTAEPVV